jgi:hypothetical protein
MASRYRKISELVDTTGVRYYPNVRYPEIPETDEDLYVITTVGDRYDSLAQQYYRDSTLWWIIASANNYDSATLVPEPGIQLRIPADVSKALQLFEEVNR